MARRIPYDPSLDGIRALAVGSVMLYHADVSWASGGFLGVDLFFVLSGYLITTLLLREHGDDGTIDLAAFWIRRAKRLLPALLAMLAWVIVYAVWIEPSAQSTGVREDALATLFYVANWHDIAQETSYFATFASPSPLLHTWSLAIEEQWYLVWPLAMFAMAGLVRRRRVLASSIVVTGIAASVVAMALVADTNDPSRAYYGTDSRAHTLFVGALLAFVLYDRQPLTSSRRRQVISIFGALCLAGLVAMMVLVADDDFFMYRGGFLVAAALAAGAIAALRMGTSGVLSRAASAAPLPAIGRISYGLYLWHWPAYVFLDEARTDLEGPALVALRVAVTFAVALASYFVLERPVQRLQVEPRVGYGGLSAAAFGALLIVLLVPAAAAETTNVRISASDLEGAPAEITPSVIETEAGPTDPSGDSLLVIPRQTSRAEPTTEPTSDAAAEPEPPSPTTPGMVFSPVAELGPPIRTLVVGDSVYLDLILHLDLDLHDRIALTADVRLGCGSAQGSPHDGCEDRLASWTSSVVEDQPHIVLVGLSTWDTKAALVDGVLVGYGTPEHTENLLASWQDDIDVLTATGARVVFVSLPCPDREGEQFDEFRLRRLNRLAQNFVEASTSDVAWLDLRRLLCPDAVHLPSIDGVDMYLDGLHYSDGAYRIVWEWLIPEIETLATAENRR